MDQLDKVKLIRLPERSGLMQARMAGFHHVTGQVAAFLDSHCEVPEGKQNSVFMSIRSQAQDLQKAMVFHEGDLSISFVWSLVRVVSHQGDF